jgi:ankyrin repeat protein
MKLPLKLTLFVVLLFSAVIAVCLLWSPLRVRYYTEKLKSEKPNERVVGVDGLLRMGRKGLDALVSVLGGGKEEAEFLSKYWSHVNREIEIDWYPIHESVVKGYIDATKLIISKGADLSVKGYKALPGGNSIHPVGKPLNIAVKTGNLKMVEMLIRYGVDVNAPAEIEPSGRIYNWTALHDAAAYGHYEIARLLIMKGADVNADSELTKSTIPTTPLAVSLLCLPDRIGDFDRQKGFHFPITDEKEHQRVAKLLIEHGGVVDHKNASGKSILFRLIERDGSPESAKLLIKAGADVNLPNSMGKTALDAAMKWGNTEVIDLLRSHGAKTGEELKASNVKRQGSGVKEEKK